MRRQLFAIISSFIFVLLFCFTSLTAFAFEEPDNSYYIDLSTSQIGNCKVYVPYNYAKYFSTSNDGRRIVNTTSSTVTCYAVDSSGNVYNVRFPSFDTPTYRRADLTGTYYDLNIINIRDSNVPFLSDTDFGIFNHTAVVNMASLLLIGVIVVICIMRL